MIIGIAPGYIVSELNSELPAGEAGEKLKARILPRRFGQI